MGARESKAVVESYQRFAFLMYQQLAKEHPGKNIFFSPLAVASTLALLVAGSREQTREQILDAIGRHPQKEIDPTFGTMIKLKRGADWTSVIYTVIFLHRRYKPRGKFLKVAKNIYRCNVQEMDFSTDPRRALQQVTQWLNDATGGQINDLGVQLQPNPLLVIANFIYHQPLWKNKFNASLTIEGQFHVEAGSSVAAQFMSQTGKFYHYFDQTLDCVMVALPYKDSKTMMILMIPQRVDGLPAVEASVSVKFLVEAMLNFKEKRDIRVILPKFCIEESYTLVPTLRALGIINLFEQNNANLMDLSNKDCYLYANQFSHKSALVVNENESKAGTVSTTVALSVKADRPFLILIYDKITNMIGFMGRLTNPRVC